MEIKNEPGLAPSTRTTYVRTFSSCESCSKLIFLPSEPIVTGASVLGIRFKDGVMVMADTLGAFTQRSIFVLPALFCSVSLMRVLVVLQARTGRLRVSRTSSAFAKSATTRSSVPAASTATSNTSTNCSPNSRQFAAVLRPRSHPTTARRTEEFCHDDGATLSPREIHSYLGRVFYNRRTKINPLWNSVITAGFRDGKR
jgi:hypothetical protein